MLTRKELMDLLEYNPETGEFFWRVKIRRTIMPGTKAGAHIGGGWWSIKYKGRGYNPARLAWWIVYDEYPSMVPVPINGDRSDFRIENLLDKSEYLATRDEKFNRRITHEDLLEVLDYNPETGVFHWKTAMGSRALAGDVAGTFCEGYWVIRIYGRGYSAARLAWFYMTGDWPVNQIDHIDREKLNNRFENLRDVTAKVNCENRDISYMQTEEYRRKKSEEVRKRHQSPEYAEKMRKAWTPAARQKLSEAMKNRWRDPASREKLLWSDERKAAQSERLRQEWQDPLYRAKHMKKRRNKEEESQ